MPLTSDVMGRGFGKVFSVHTTKVLQVFNDKGDEGGFDLGFGLGIEHDFAPGLRVKTGGIEVKIDPRFVSIF
jgi:hypothetical protein